MVCVVEIVSNYRFNAPEKGQWNMPMKQTADGMVWRFSDVCENMQQFSGFKSLNWIWVDGSLTNVLNGPARGVGCVEKRVPMLLFCLRIRVKKSEHNSLRFGEGFSTQTQHDWWNNSYKKTWQVELKWLESHFMKQKETEKVDPWFATAEEQ